jgi:hypothetical protein
MPVGSGSDGVFSSVAGSPNCLCICVFPRLLEPVISKLVSIMAPEPISTAHITNPSHKSACLYVSGLSLLGNGSVKTLPRSTHGTIDELLDSSFSLRSASYKEKYATSSSQNFLL